VRLRKRGLDAEGEHVVDKITLASSVRNGWHGDEGEPTKVGTQRLRRAPWHTSRGLAAIAGKAPRGC